MNRPLAKTKNNPPKTNTTQTGTGAKFEMSNVTTHATATNPEKTRKRPNESASLPTSGAVKTVKIPPVK